MGNRKKFTPGEIQPTGKYYPPVPLFKLRGQNIENLNPIYNRPISAKENWRLLFEGKKPYWIPVSGIIGSDVQDFRPRLNPDNVANHQVFDGGPEYPYDKEKTVYHSDWFDLDWVWDEEIGGVTVRPGNPKVVDIENWENYIHMPDLERIDWEQCARENAVYLGSDKMNQLGIQCGLWERLMALMNVEEACIALIDEDLQPSVHRFFDAYSDFLIQYIGKIADVCPIDCVKIHADWAHQSGPFMSPDTAREMLLPYVKKIVDYCHSRGIFYEIHCCGACEKLVPVFLETGADMWAGQENLNDFGAYAKKYKESPFVFAVPSPEVDPEAPEEEVRKAAKAWVEEYKDCHVAVRAMNEVGYTHPDMVKYIYEYSRIAYEEE